MATTVYTAIIEKEGDLYAALCPELDVANQGATDEEAGFASCRDAKSVGSFSGTGRRSTSARKSCGSHIVMQRRAEAGSVTVPIPDHREG